MERTVAALYVQKNGAYYGLEGVDPWDEKRDARLYDGPYPVVAHPPCQRWSAFGWWGGASSPKRFSMGDDGGCFSAAIAAVRQWGGVIEHPAHSHAWAHHGLVAPLGYGVWIPAGDFTGWTIQVDQWHFGHKSPKATWLYAVRCSVLPDTHLRADGGVPLGGGGRIKTPHAFRDLLLGMARSVYDGRS